MNKGLGLLVIFTDKNGLSRPAIISALNQDGSVDLVHFVSADNGYRNDQASVQFSVQSAPNTWSNVPIVQSNPVS